MQTLQIQQATISSLEVAEMINKEHKNLLRDISNYVDVLHGSKMSSENFFIKGTYQNSRNQTQPCYLLTRKGCDMVANKMTGEKGILFTATYVTRFEEMEKQLTTPRLPQSYKEALQHLITQLEENEKLQTHNLVLEQRVNELQPKASYYDLILQNKTLLAISTIAKDYGMSATAMNKLLNQFLTKRFPLNFLRSFSALVVTLKTKKNMIMHFPNCLNCTKEKTKQLKHR